MTVTEQRSLLTICLMAAFADGLKDDREREAIKRVAETLAAPNEAPQLASVYQEVLLKRVDLAQVAAALTDPDHRQLAYELAVCVCDADGLANEAEQGFLATLKQTLGLADPDTARAEAEAGSIADAPLSPLA